MADLRCRKVTGQLNRPNPIFVGDHFVILINAPYRSKFVYFFLKALPQALQVLTKSFPSFSR